MVYAGGSVTWELELVLGVVDVCGDVLVEKTPWTDIVDS